MIDLVTAPERLNSDVEELPPSLTCWECNVNFISDHYLTNHLLFHIKQPSVLLTRVEEPPLKIVLKSNKENGFEIVPSPNGGKLSSSEVKTPSGGLDNEKELPPEEEEREEEEEEEEEREEEEEKEEKELEEAEEHENAAEEEAMAEDADVDGEEPDFECGSVKIHFSPNFIGENGMNSNESSSPEDNNEKDEDECTEVKITPVSSSPEFPKIRIKTGLLKEPLTITEITDDDAQPELIDLNSGSENGDSAYGSTDESSIWTTPSLEDPLRIPDGGESDGSLISNLFNSNNDRAKDLGFTTSESEFMPLDRFEDRNRNALQVYSSTAASSHSQSPLDTLAGLPMQQLAEQVSRLQPGGSSAMHQQNVLINIQQFQQPPPPPPPQPHSYQPPPMYPHPPHPGVPPQPMYHQPYQYQPPNPMYYPPGHGYMPPPPRPPPMSQPQMPQAGPQPMTSVSQSYSQPGAPRHPQMNPRQPMQSQRQPAPRQPMGPRQPMTMSRQRAPMVRPRGVVPMAMRGPRPRMNTPSTTLQGQQGPRMIKRSPEQMQALQAKRKRMDFLVPDRHDDADCEVIAVQPKNTGLPQIQSIQGNAPEPGDTSHSDSVMHLSDSITLSVRNPSPRAPSPKKSDAKDVANILATRGITVTAAPKPKKAPTPPPKKPSPPPLVLNSAVSIIPANKSNNNVTNGKTGQDPKLPTVDLTDDNIVERPHPPKQAQPPPQKAPASQSQKVLPFQCDLCPAKYPNSISLSKHRQSFHKTGGLSEFGIPLIDLKQPGLVHRLTAYGIYNYIPLPAGASANTTFALPVISATNRNVASNLGNMGVSSILSLGPIRTLPRPQAPAQNHNNKQ